MDLHELCRIFAATLNPDRNYRDAAESALYELSNNPSLPVILLQFATMGDSLGGAATPSIKLAAACRLRNVICKSDWNRVAYFTEEVKAQIKALIVPAVCSTQVEEAVRRQIVSTMEYVVGYDYPKRWEGLVAQLQQLLGESIAAIESGSMEACVALRGGLQALRFCCKRYENVTLCTTDEIDGFAANFLPPLLQLCRRLTEIVSTVPTPSEYFSTGALGKRQSNVTEVYHCIRITWKCVWSLTDSRWPRCLCDVQAATCFFDLLLFSHQTVGGLIAAVDVNAVGRGGESEVSCVPLQQIAAWRLVKWLGKISSRCISTLGIAPRATEKRARAAANLLHDRYVAPLTQHALALVKWHDNGTTMINSKAFILALECLELAVSHQAAYVEHLLPSSEQLLTSLLFRRLRFSSEDAELWTTNPEEYVRKLTDPRGDLFNAKLLSMGFIVTLCHARKPYHSQELLMSFITFLLTKLAALSQSLSQGSIEIAGPEYDGCLYAIAQMKKLFAHDHQVDDGKIEWLLLTYVTPLLSCPIGYLRAKAVYVLSLFNDIAWSAPGTYSNILQAVIPLLKDEELPVRIQTCVCLSRFIRTDAAREVMTPQIGAVVEQYFQIMRQMDNDGVVRTLRKTVSFYGDALSVWATDLCRMLVQHFLTVHEQLSSKQKDLDADMGDEEDETIDSLLAADELMETLRTLVQAVPREESARATMQAMQETLAPLLTMIMSVRQGANLGFMDAALHLLTTVVSRSLAIAPSFWSIAALLFHVGLDASFMDYVEHLIAPIDNFLSVDPVGFLDYLCCTAPDGAHASCGEMVVHLCQAIITNGSSFHHLSTAPKLIDAVLLQTWSCGSTTPKAQWVCTQLLQQSLGVLSSRAATMPQTLQTLFADNILVGLFAAPTITVPLLESTGAPQFIMDSIVGLLQAPVVRSNLRVFDRKVVMMSFAALLNASASSATAQVLASSVASSPLLAQFAVEDARLMTNEVAYHQKRLSGKLDDSDDEHDEAWDNSSDDDDDTDVTGSDLDDDMDDEDVGSDVSEDGDIRNEAQFSTVLAQANKMRDAALGEDFDDGEENFLDDNDFETPLDDTNVWRVVGEAAAQTAFVSHDNTMTAVAEASRLFDTCVELRNAKHPATKAQ